MATSTAAVASTVTSPLPAGQTFSLYGDTFKLMLFEHYLENMLVCLFCICLGMMMWATHYHNDPLCGWAQSMAGNILSALFGIMVKQKTT